MDRKSVTEWARKRSYSVRATLSVFPRKARRRTYITAPAGKQSLITTKDWYAYGHADHSGFPYQSNHPNATENDFWKEMYIQYNTRDMVKRFGEAVLQYIKRQMK